MTNTQNLRKKYIKSEREIHKIWQKNTQNLTEKYTKSDREIHKIGQWEIHKIGQWEVHKMIQEMFINHNKKKPNDTSHKILFSYSSHHTLCTSGSEVQSYMHTALFLMQAVVFYKCHLSNTWVVSSRYKLSANSPSEMMVDSPIQHAGLATLFSCIQGIVS